MNTHNSHASGAEKPIVILNGDILPADRESPEEYRQNTSDIVEGVLIEGELGMKSKFTKDLSPEELRRIQKEGKQHFTKSPSAESSFEHEKKEREILIAGDEIRYDRKKQELEDLIQEFNSIKDSLTEYQYRQRKGKIEDAQQSLAHRQFLLQENKDELYTFIQAHELEEKIKKQQEHEAYLKQIESDKKRKTYIQYIRNAVLGLLAIGAINLDSGNKEAEHVGLPLSTQTYSNKTDQELYSTIKEYENAINIGQISKSVPLGITQMKPLHTQKDLEQIVTGGSLLPKKTWDELTGYHINQSDIGANEFNSSVYKNWIEKLFDTSDISLWYRKGFDKHIPSDSESQEYIASVNLTKDTYLQLFGKWNGLIKDNIVSANIYNDFKDLFLQGVTNIQYPSRETFRRLLIASSSIAYHKNLLKPTSGANNIQQLTPQIGEYMLLTDNTAKGTKVVIGNFTYIFPNLENIKSDHTLAQFRNISQEALASFKAESDKNLNLLTLMYMPSVYGDKPSSPEKQIEDIRNSINVLNEDIFTLLSFYNYSPKEEYIEKIKLNISSMKFFLQRIDEQIALQKNNKGWIELKNMIVQSEKHVAGQLKRT